MTIRFDTGNAVEIEEKALHEGDDCWTFTGYAAVFNTVDQGNDIIMPGAFKHSLDKFGLPQILFQHKMDDAPVGVCTEAREDRKGLFVKGELPKDDAFVRDRLVPQLKRRALKGMSIGYRPIDKERRKDGVRLLKSVRLYEASFVTFPMHLDAGVESVKGIVPFQDLPIDTRNVQWDSQAAIKRLRAHFGCEDRPSEEYKSAFLYVDEEKADDWDAYRFPIADVDDSGRLVANRVAIMKSVAAISGARKGDLLPEEAESGVRAVLERYYQRMNLDAPFKSLSVAEWKALDVGERKARLQEFGLSRSLAADLASVGLTNRSAGADRNPSQTQVGSTEEAKQLLTTFSAISKLAAAINNAPK